MRLATSILFFLSLTALIGCSDSTFPVQPESISPAYAQSLRRFDAEQTILDRREERLAARRQFGVPNSPYINGIDELDELKLQSDLDWQLQSEARLDDSRWPGLLGGWHGFIAPANVAVRKIWSLNSPRHSIYNYPNEGFVYDAVFLIGIYCSVGTGAYWLANFLGFCCVKLKRILSSKR